MARYAHPEMLVETEWVAAHGSQPGVRIVEVDVDTAAYDEDHIQGAIGWNWTTQLCDTVQRDIIPRDAFEGLMAKSSITNLGYPDVTNYDGSWTEWGNMVRAPVEQGPDVPT